MLLLAGRSKDRRVANAANKGSVEDCPLYLDHCSVRSSGALPGSRHLTAGLKCHLDDLTGSCRLCSYIQSSLR